MANTRQVSLFYVCAIGLFLGLPTLAYLYVSSLEQSYFKAFATGHGLAANDDFRVQIKKLGDQVLLAVNAPDLEPSEQTNEFFVDVTKSELKNDELRKLDAIGVWSARPGGVDRTNGLDADVSRELLAQFRELHAAIIEEVEALRKDPNPVSTLAA